MHEIWYGAHPLRYLLMPLSGLTLIAIKVRRIWHTCTRPAPPTAPVLIVGNLTVGGTGKTPLTLAIAEHLSRIGYRPGIASRGYGGRCAHYPHRVTAQDSAKQVGDEALMLRRKSAYPIVVAPDRCAAVARLINAADADRVVCDDGLQHYRLHRDVEIAVVDGVRLLGNRLPLPAGPLREPPSRLDEVDFVVFGGMSSGTLARRMKLPPEKCFAMYLQPEIFENLTTGERYDSDGFAGQSVHACAGIAHPRRFFDTLKALDIKVHAHAYPDHHHYRMEDLCFEPDLPVVVTEKDAVKCDHFAAGNIWVLRMKTLVEGAFWRALDKRLAQVRAV